MRLITTEILEEAIGSLTRKDGKPLAASSKRSVATIAKMFFNYAANTGIITTSPAEHLDTSWGSTETSRTALIPSLTDAEALAVALDQTWPLPRWCRDLTGPNGEGYGDLVRLLVYTGVRISELFATPETAWDRKRAKIGVQPTVTESGGRREYRPEHGKSKASTRWIVVLPQAVPALERMLAIANRGRELEPARAARRRARNSKRTPNRPDAELWTLIANGEYGGFMSYGHWRKKLTVAQELSGVEYTAHELRHVFASLLYAAGEDEDAITYQMGHSSSAVTRNIYRHMFNLSHAEMSKRVGAKAEAITAEERAAAEAELADEDAPLYLPEDNE